MEFEIDDANDAALDVPRRVLDFVHIHNLWRRLGLGRAVRAVVPGRQARRLDPGLRGGHEVLQRRRDA